jgi:hypothetical protein
VPQTPLGHVRRLPHCKGLQNCLSRWSGWLGDAQNPGRTLCPLPVLAVCWLSTMSDMASSSRSTTPSLLDKLDDITHTPLAQFDAFPKLPSTYKARSESRGFLTIFVTLMAFLLVVNDLGEYIWGWPDYEFSVDQVPANQMNVNVDVVVNMPCQCEFFTVTFGSTLWETKQISSYGYYQPRCSATD